MALPDFLQPYDKRYPEQARQIEAKVREFAGLVGRKDIVIDSAAWRTSDPFASIPRDHDELRRVRITEPGTVQPSERTVVERHHKVPLAMASNYIHPETVTRYTEVVPVSPSNPYFNREVARYYLAQQHDHREIRYGMRVLRRLQREHVNTQS